jgi:DNA-binding SARP family transcriptional activator
MIQISLLGDIHVLGPAGQRAVMQTRRGAELLAFLVLEAGRSFDRGRLAEQFWGHLPETRARRALNTEFWRMTQSLRDVGVDTDDRFPRSVNGLGYHAQADCVVDVDIMRAAMAVVRTTSPAEANAEAIATVEAGVTAYRGDLLETVYSDWCLLWRENLRAQQFEALDFLREAAMARQDWSSGLRFGRALLALDPLQEHVHRAVMRCHFHNGDRPLAMRQYAVCEQVLREELGVEPMDETRRIQQTILAVPGMPVASADPGQPRPRIRRRNDLRSPVQKVDMALSNLNTARSWLEEVSADLRK